MQNADGPLFGVAAPTTSTSDSSEDVFTYSIAPKFKFNDRMAIYARVAKGFRPGGPNVIAPAPRRSNHLRLRFDPQLRTGLEGRKRGPYVQP